MSAKLDPAQKPSFYFGRAEIDLADRLPEPSPEFLEAIHGPKATQLSEEELFDKISQHLSEISDSQKLLELILADLKIFL